VILFVRHGRTAVNREGRLQGRIDAPLDETGIAQAHALAVVLAGEQVTRVVSSPLRRARETAAAIAEPHTLAVGVDDRLIELDYGDWDGVPLRDLAPDGWARWRADPAFTPPGGESLVDVAGRIASFCDDTLAAADQHIVAVSHVSPIKAAVSWALGAGPAASWRMHLSVASITRIGAGPDGGILLAYNETVT
jgi:probable phosphoglycerate mutase